MFINPLRLQYLPDECNDRLVRTTGVASSFQNRGVTRFQAEREYVETDVRTGLVDHADYAEGDRNFLDTHAVRTYRFAEYPTQWRGQRNDVSDVGSDTGNTFPIQQQPVVHRIGRIHTRQILLVGSQNLIGILFGRIGQCQ